MKVLIIIAYTIWALGCFFGVYYLNFRVLELIFELSLFLEIVAVFILLGLLIAMLKLSFTWLLIFPLFKYKDKSLSYPVYIIGVWFSLSLIYAAWFGAMGDIHWIEKIIVTINGLSYLTLLTEIGAAFSLPKTEFSVSEA